MAFDCWVQQGRMYNTAITKAKSSSDELTALEALAAGQRDGMNAAARAAYGEDVYSRRMTIAKGYGKINGSLYELSDYGINLISRL